MYERGAYNRKHTLENYLCEDKPEATAWGRYVPSKILVRNI